MPTTPTTELVQLRVELEEIEPRVWRRIRVRGDATFWDLHVAIQDAMGWLDCHLHEFWLEGSRGPSRIGLPFEEGECVPGWEVSIGGLLRSGDELTYLYDFGAGWRHRIVVEERGPRSPEQELPRCVAGERCCPPESCGGPRGYLELLEAYRDPSHRRHDEVRELHGGEFDPEAFEPRAVAFEDPQARLEASLRDV